MATYYDIFGQKVQYLSSDPSNVVEGQVWYNAPAKVGKVQGFNTAAWATGGAYPQNIGTTSTIGAGTQTAGLMVGGYSGPAPIPSGGGRTSFVGEYNGTSWSSGGSWPTYTDAGGIGGTQTVAITAGEFRNDSTQYYTTSLDYDGSSWTANNPIPAAASTVSVLGTQAAAIGAGGQLDNPYPDRFAYNKTMDWNGTNWTDTGGTMSNRRIGNARAGAADAAMMIAGQEYAEGSSPSGKLSAVENYDGTSWSSGPAVNTARSGLAGGGTQSLAWISGGTTGSATAATEEYDGSSWTNSTNMNNAMECSSGAVSTRAAGWACGGYTLKATEEFTGSGPSTQTIATT